MKLILKHTFKNIWAHKLRTLMLIFCIFGCSLAALLSLDMSNSIEGVLRSALADIAGSTDIIFSSDVAVDENFMEGAPENITVPIISGSETFIRKIPDMYGYVHKDEVSVLAMELTSGKKLGILPDSLELESREAAVSEKFADDYGYKEGDTLILHNKKKEPVEFTVKSIQPAQGLFMKGTLFVINQEDVKLLSLKDKLEVNTAYIDVKDNDRISEMVDFLEAKYPSADVENVFRSEEMQEAIASVVRVFYVLFVVCLLLVVFVTISVSERLIVEKMSVIGTMRSLGISSAMTTFSLLLENIIYGLAGGILGCYVYNGLREALLTSLFTFQTSTGEAISYNISAAQFGMYAAIVAGAVILECICPIKEIIKAVRTPIRDIIFDNKDTQYKASRFSTAAGIVCAAAAVVSAFFPESFAASIICFAAIAAAAAMLFPFVLRFIAKLLERLFVKLRKPVARLAAVEVYSKKSTVGSAVLCVTASALSIVIFLFSGSLKNDYLYNYFKCDVIAMTNSFTERSMYSYTEDLPDVTDYEYVYTSVDVYKMDGEEITGFVYGWNDGGYEMFDALKGVPDTIGYDEIVLDKHLMKKYGYSVGDTAEFVFKSDMFMPVTRKLKIAGVCEKDHYSGSGASTIISEKLFTDIYHDYPSHILLKSGNPEATSAAIEKYSADNVINVYTEAEYAEQMVMDSSSVIGILNALMILGIGLTFVGMLSNQLIGFEGRKRECAVLTSAVMTKGQLAGMFLQESFIASLVSVAAAVPLSLLMINRFMVLMEQLQMYVDLYIAPTAYIGFAVMLIAVFTLTALFPIRAMKKMDTVEQLKYE